ncbi:MAG: hypothetical protein K6W08_15030, partial [Firmicutes bacterium]|nr:hypothetical protein [Bacillota bacterium]
NWIAVQFNTTRPPFNNQDARMAVAKAIDRQKFIKNARFGLAEVDRHEVGECLSGLVLQGQIKPPQCPAFGSRCTPEHPLGAPMVSAEGACAAYYHYRDRSPRQRSAAAMPWPAEGASHQARSPSTARDAAPIDAEGHV